MTKNYLIICYAIVVSVFPLLAQNAGDTVFASIKVHEIKINFSQPNYRDSLLYYYNQGNEQYMQVSVTLNGNLMDSIGVRLKGNSSLNHPNDKKSLRLSFDEFVDDKRWDGLKGVHLNNNYGDPTFMREKVHLDFCRDAGVVAPRANYANVFINDSLFGFFTLVEHVNKTFLKTRFGNSNGDLFKAVDAFEGVQAASDFRWFTSVPDSYYNRYELKSDSSSTAWLNIVNLLDTLNNFPNTEELLPAKINLSNFYKAIASDVLFANLDSYNNSGRNFYFYFNTATNKMEWIAWDVGLSFGCYSGGVSNFENLNIAYLLSSTYRPLTGKIFAKTSLKQNYLYTVCQLFNSYFTTEKLFSKIDSLTTIIRPYVYADPRKQYTNTQFETNIFADLNINGVAGTNRIPGLKSFITSRVSSVQAQLNNLGINCTSGLNDDKLISNTYYLFQNYPNPFNPSTVISYELFVDSYVTLKVFDILGREITTLINNEFKTLGKHEVEFTIGSAFAGGLHSGVYFYQLQTDNLLSTKKMILLK